MSNQEELKAPHRKYVSHIHNEVLRCLENPPLHLDTCCILQSPQDQRHHHGLQSNNVARSVTNDHGHWGIQIAFLAQQTESHPIFQLVELVPPFPEKATSLLYTTWSLLRQESW